MVTNRVGWENMQKVSAHQRLKISIQGLEFIAVSHASPYQEANVSEMKDWKASLRKLKSLCWKTEESMREVEGSEVEAEECLEVRSWKRLKVEEQDCSCYEEQKQVRPSSFSFHIIQVISCHRVDPLYNRV